MSETNEPIIEEESLLFEGEDLSEEDAEIHVQKRNIVTQPSDPEIISLFNKWKKGKLILQPDFQRQFVWDKKKASRLIESVLLQVPLPIIYLAEDEDGKEYVIDGQQRLTSLFSFINGKFPDNESDFKLTGLTVYSELNRKTFSEIDEKLQDKIQSYAVRTITIKKESDHDIRFEIFERLNTGSVPLNDMEIRNCVFRGPYIELLKELASDKDFRLIMGLDGYHPRMKDIELILRFASFYHFTYLKYQYPMKSFFNKDMEKYQYISQDDAGDLRNSFKNSVQILKSLFGTNAFKRYYKGTDKEPNGSWEIKKFNASLFDVWMGIFADKDKNQVYGCLDSIREGLLDLMSTNEDFIDAILISTSSKEKVKLRFDLARKVVEDILSTHEKQPRCFTHEYKEKLYTNNPTCAICGQKISHIDDAAVDHIKQYWMGGMTIEKNARLAHRYCNCARPRHE